MDTQYTLSSTEARQKFAEMIDRVAEGGARYTVTVNGRPKVVVMDAEELESMEETMAVLSDPNLMKQIRASEEEFARGEGIPLDDLFAGGFFS